MSDRSVGPVDIALVLLLLGVGFATRTLTDLASLLLLAALSRFGPKTVFFFVCTSAAIWLIAIALTGIGGAALTTFFGRELDLTYDLFLVPVLWDLSVDAFSAPFAVILFSLITGVLLALVYGVTRCYQRMAECADIRVAAVLASLLIVTALSGRDVVRTSHSLGAGLIAAYNVASSDKAFERKLVEARRSDLVLPKDLALLQQRDLVVIFIESYGRILWDDQLLWRDYKSTLSRFESELASSGWEASSHFLDSSVVGGSSWLAHMTFSTGVHCGNQLCWKRLLNSDVKALPRFLTDKGYEAIDVLPAMDIDAWPEGDFFGFTRHVWSKELGYRGPKYAWSPMPDQYVLFKVWEEVFATASQPLFVEISLTSSHAPWSVVPPLHGKEPSLRALEETLSAAPPPRRDRMIWFDISADDYLRAQTYSMESTLGFLTQAYSRDAIFLILGDHQPTQQVQRINSKALGHERHVPLHVIARAGEVHGRLRDLGFQAGLQLSNEATVIPMSTMKGLLLRVFHSEDS